MLELAFAAMMAADYAQTMDIKQHQGFYETNRILGPHPSDARVRNYFVAMTAAHWAITNSLPEQYRPAWQWGSIAVEATFLLRNRAIGLRIAF